MRIILLIFVPIAAAVAAAIYLAPEFREPRHVYYLVQCQLSPSVIINHIVTAEGFGGGEALRGIRARLRSRTTPAAGFCWHCRKPLHARTDPCPFCGEAQ